MTVRRSRLLCALLSTLSAAVVGTGVLTLGTVPAEAAVAASPTYNVIDRPTGTVTADYLPTVQIDGVVWDTAIVGDTVYAGGQFANARPAGAAAGTNLTPRSNLLSFSLSTGVLNSSWAPSVNGRIRSMALSPDKSRLYIAGSFTSVNGQPRYRVAAFNTSDGSLVSSFAPVFGSDVFSLAVTNNAVYAGGWFTSVNGVARSRIAAVSPTNGATLAWAPSVDSTVNTMTLSQDNSRLIIGGIFANVNGAFSPGLASLDASTGTSYPFAANSLIQNYGDTAGIQSLKTVGSSIVGTAYWFGGTGTFEGPFVADANTGNITSMADCHGDTYDSTVANNVLYTVSHHHDCSNINGFPDTNPRNRWQRANAFTLAATTTVGHNTAGGLPRLLRPAGPVLDQLVPRRRGRDLHRTVPGRLDDRVEQPVRRRGRRVPDREQPAPAGTGAVRGPVDRPEQAGSAGQRDRLRADRARPRPDLGAGLLAVELRPRRHEPDLQDLPV